MNKKLLFICVSLLLTSMNFAQTTNLGGPISWGQSIEKHSNIPFYTMAEVDVEALIQEDLINDPLKDAPWRFGFKHDANITLADGVWTDLSNGDRLWTVGLECTGATTVNLIFEDLHIPTGAHLYLSDVDRTNRVGAYTSRNNREDGVLGTELVHGDKIIVEYFEPAQVVGQGKLTIANVTHGYRALAEHESQYIEYAKALNSSGACNIDVNCPLGAGWENQIRSVAMIVVGGSGICSGTLINNSCNDGTPYFLTANHCTGGGVSSWAFRWNWKSPIGTESCATNANSVDPGSPYDQTSNGATMLVQGTQADHALVLIDNMTEADAADWNLYYAGWNNDDTDGLITEATGIHHPSGDVMKICREDNSPYHNTASGAQVWYINAWEQGVTEPGSSGSGLFDQNGRLIGQLYGGAAACSGTNNNGAYDFYGRLGVSWGLGIGGYLDPVSCGGSNVTNDGYDPVTYCNSTYANSSTSETCFGDATGTVDVSFLTGVTAGATFDIGNGPQATGAFTGLTQGSYSVVVIDGEACATTVNVTVSGPAVLSAGAGLAAEVTPFTGSINLNVSGGTPGYTFAWTGPNGFTAATEDISGLEGGSYAITITDVNGCTFSSSYTVNSFVGIDELSPDMVNVYPNPTKGTINIAVHSGLSGTFNAKVLDLSGRVIMNNTIESNSVLTMDLSNKSNGTYILELSNDNTRLTKRIVLKK